MDIPSLTDPDWAVGFLRRQTTGIIPPGSLKCATRSALNSESSKSIGQKVHLSPEAKEQAEVFQQARFFCGRTLKTTTYWFLCKSMLSRKQHVSKQEVIQATICNTSYNILQCEGLRARDKSWQIQTNLSCRFCVCV